MLLKNMTVNYIFREYYGITLKLFVKFPLKTASNNSGTPGI